MKSKIKLFLIPLIVGCLLAHAEIHRGLVGGYLCLVLAGVLAVNWLWMLPRRLKALPVLLAALMVCMSVQAQSVPPPSKHRQTESLGLPGAIIVGAVVVVAGYYLYRWLYHFADTKLNPPPPQDGGTNQPPGSATE